MAEEKREVKQIVKGTAKQKSLAEKAGDLLLSEDARTVKDYIFWERFLPWLREGIADMAIGFIDMWFFGSTRSRKSQRRGGETHVSYDGYYDRSSRSGSNNRVDRSIRADRYDFSNIYLDTRGDAEEVVTAMEELVKKYGEANVSDLNSLVGVTSRHTDNKWGWTDIRDFNYRRSGRGYILDFAPPEYLD